MTHVSFYCANANGSLLDQRAAEVDDLYEARDCANGVVRSLIAAATLQDWRDCRLHVCDDFGDELFVVPFSSALGKPH